MLTMKKHSGRALLIDELYKTLRAPTAAPILTPAEVISAALSLFVPGPANEISPTGRGTRLILLTLKKMGYKIVPMERADYETEKED